MKSYLIFHNINELEFIKISNEIRQTLACSDINLEQPLDIRIQNSLLLSNTHDWDDNHDEILYRLSLITTYLSNLIDFGVRIDIHVCFDMQFYNERNLTTFIFMNTFSDILSKLRIGLEIKILQEICVCCACSGDLK
jgi:hypothetical protein